MASTSAVTLLFALTSAGCSTPTAAPSIPTTSATQRTITTIEPITPSIETATILDERDAFHDAQIAGTLGSFVENGKAYFTVTDGEKQVTGLVFAVGYNATPDGNALMWTGERIQQNKRVFRNVLIAEVGDHVEFGGGTASDEDGSHWDASYIPPDGLNLVVTAIPAYEE
jgi:hypothetical protein